MRLAKETNLDDLRQEVQELYDMAEIILFLIHQDRIELLATMISQMECQAQYIPDAFCVRER